MANFDPYFPNILKFEGTVYENDSTDTGGCTHFGLILDDVKTFFNKPNATCEDVKALTKDDAKAMYKKMYWDKFKADEIKNQSLAEYIVDGAINQGVGTITNYIQQILGLEADGIFGSKTLAGVNSHDGADLYSKLKQKRIDKYNRIVENNPSQVKFIKGWMNRVNAIDYSA